MKIKVHHYLIDFIVGFFLLLIVSLYAFTRLGVTDQLSAIVSIGVVCIGSGLVYLGFFSTIPKRSAGICYLGYLLRCICMMVDLYGRDYIMALHSGDDADTFAAHASGLYNGTLTGSVSTKYPYVINWMYHVTGENRLLVQYANVILWVLSAGILARICKRFCVKVNVEIFILTIWAVLPMGILLSSILMRESAEMFFCMWSFERFVLWMQEGKIRYCMEAFCYVLPSIILHSASVALWMTYAVVLLIWDTRLQRFRIQQKTWMMFFVMVFAGSIGLVLFRATEAWIFLFGKLGGDFSWYGISHRVFSQGGSDYLADMDCQSWMQFVPYTIVRMFYFLFSPLPTDARGVMDLMAFLADGLPLAIIICYTLIRIKRQKEIRGYAVTAILGGLFFVAIFAWGVRNAGTAIRHRYLAWSIFIIAFALCFGNRRQNEMEAS